MGETIKVLITVKTYPNPSEGYQELVCTAGVREDGSWIRLYPIDYRYRKFAEWYSKYEWIELEVEKNLKDPRPESYRPVNNAQIRSLGKPLDTKNNWKERKKYVFQQPIQTMCELNQLSQKEKSLGIIRPREVIDLIVEPVDREWKPQWQQLFEQEKLFGPKQKPLEKIPYKFSYRYKCTNPACSGHTMMIEDWEIGQLFRTMRDKFGNEEIAIEKVKSKFLTEICGPSKDTHFFVGTVLAHNTWIVLGTFWPKKEK